MKTHDLIIVGAGPAGLAAAIYAKNDDLDFEIIEKEDPGWFAKISIDSHYYVDNYPGRYNKITGSELIKSFRDHLKYLNVKIKKGDVKDIKLQKNGLFSVKLKTKKSSEKILTKTVILCTGTVPKKLAIPNENMFLDRGLSYYCVKDGKKFVKKRVLVIGGRNSGTVAAIYLKKLGCLPTIIEMDNKLNARPKYIKRLSKLKIPYALNAKIIELRGKNGIEKAVIEHDGRREIIDTSAVFSCIGLLPNNTLAKQIGIKLNKEGYIKINNKCETSIPGVFAAGDITGNLKQVVVACGQGAVAEYLVNKYLA